MWPNITRVRLNPSALAASTYSSLPRLRKLERTMRATASQPVRPRTRMIEFSLRPNTTAIATARMM